MHRELDTIVALGTPPGRSAIAVLRVSGPDAVPLVDARFRGRRALAALSGGRTAVGVVVGAGGEPLDEVVATVFRSPHSYTGEDVVEVTCHGNPVLAEAVVDALVSAGARHAEPGEFTRRAFLNGRLDLTQAEAVAGVIAARGEAAARGALRQLRGEFSDRVRALRGRVVDVVARLEAHIDFPDQDLSDLDEAGVSADIQALERDVTALADAVRRGRPLTHRAGAVLVGTPNVGKSSLFNALLGQARAIVHAVPGTTRDVVDAEVDLEGVPVRLVDTAGLGEARDDVEREGVSRSQDEGERADVVLFILDASRSLSESEARALGTWDPGRLLVVDNKTDLPRRRSGPPEGAIRVSATSGAGIPALRQAIRSSILGGLDTDERWVTSHRQEALVAAAVRSVGAAAAHATAGLATPELVVEELRGAAGAFDAITGERIGPEVLDTIFAEFCIGK